MKRIFLLFAAVGLLFVGGCGDDNHDVFTVENAIVDSHGPGPTGGGFVESFTICNTPFVSSGDRVAATPQCAGVATGGLVAFSSQGVAGTPGSELTGADQSTGTNRGIANTVVLDANQASNSIDIFFVQPDGTLVAPATGSAVPSGVTGANAIALTPNTIGTIFVYVAGPSGAASTINGFALDTSSGILSQLPGFPVSSHGSGTKALVVDRTGTLLFSVNDGTNTVTRFGINGATGALAFLGSTATGGASTVSATTDPANRFLYVADDTGNGRVRVFAIGAGGTLTQVAGSPFVIPAKPGAAEQGAEDLVVDGTSGFLYVANEDAGVATFGIAGGAPFLTFVGFTTAPGGPFNNPGRLEGITIDPSNNFVIATDNRNAGVDSFAGAGSGALAAVAGSPFPTCNGITCPDPPAPGVVAGENPNRVTTATFTTAVP